MSDGLYLGLLIYLAVLVSGAFLHRLSRDKRLPKRSGGEDAGR